MRGRATQISAGPISYRERVVAFYEKNPTATLEQAWRATGAPRRTVIRLRQILQASGKVPVRICCNSLERDP